MTVMLGAGLGLLLLAVLVWPSRWADPRKVFWRDRPRAAPGQWGSGARRAGSGRAAGPVAGDVATAAQLLAIALRTGLPLQEALERVVRRCPPALGTDLWPVVAAYERGADSEEAWRPVPEVWRPVAAALTIASQAGLAPGPLLLTAAQSVTRRESVLREGAIGRVSVRLVLPLGAVLLPAFMCTTVIPLVLVMARGFLGD